ncbi:hypothetical protein BG004_003169 [Podila humilis]|nr:hypothetical protein BG004_003169 [Podila humilis]
MAAMVAPVLAAKTWDINFADSMFAPQELDIAPGDSVNWLMNDNTDHAIVETIPGPRTCNSKIGGFNSGRKTPGQTYTRVFPLAGVVNYKDGIGANCLKGATGTIYIHNGTRPTSGIFTRTATGSTTMSSSAGTSTTSMGTAVTTTASTMSTTISTVPTGNPTGTSTTAAPISTPSQTPSGAGMLMSAEKSVLLGVTMFIGALVL